MDLGSFVRSIGGSSHFYGNASNGYVDVVRYFAERSGVDRPAVLLPSYIPSKMIRATIAAGCEPRYYEVHGACTFDLDDVRRALDEHTIALVAVHYFGFVDRIDALVEIAARAGVPLIEDCVHALGGRHDGQWIGTFGDASLFSLRKMLVLPEGGLVRLAARHHDFSPRYEGSVPSLFSAYHVARGIFRRSYNILFSGRDPLKLNRLWTTRDLDLGRPQTVKVKRISHFTRWLAGTRDLEADGQRRRENYLFLESALSTLDRVVPVHPQLPIGCVPYSFPILVDGEHRERYLEAILGEGLSPGGGWPESPFDPRLERGLRLARALIEIPIYPQVQRRQLERVLTALAAASAETRIRSLPSRRSAAAGRNAREALTRPR